MQAAGEDSSAIGGARQGPAAMASGSPGERLCEEARCPVCLDFCRIQPVWIVATVSASDASPSSARSPTAHRAASMPVRSRGPFRLESLPNRAGLASLVDKGAAAGPGR